MTEDLQQLVRETISLTGAAGPGLMEQDAVALRTDAEAPFYLVGLIGGKEVGKSSLVNALAGKDIAQVTSFGEGTARVTAYAHESVVEPLRQMLERDVPGQFAIIAHQERSLRTQVLLDLPDIDSRFQSHLALTRTMLRRMLYPVWIQSIEKYADIQPQKMLKEVAEGNSPENFLFCLSKADQLKEAGDAEELRADFAGRIGRTLALAKTPGVYLISSRAPERFDLPSLRTQLSRERSEREVGRSIVQAGEQQGKTLLAWLHQQDLPERAARAGRLSADAKELLRDRVGSPLLEEVVPKIANDPLHRAGIAAEVFERRVDKWPIVRLLNLVLSPAVTMAETLVRGRSAGAALQQDRADQIEPIVRPLSAELQAAMAHLRQAQPAVAPLYESNKLWEPMHADAAVARLRESLAATVLQQRVEATKRLANSVFPTGFERWILTIGAALWFPLIQPLLELILNASIVWTPVAVLRLIVSLLSGAKLLESATFLLIWYVLLWLMIRYRTFRQVKTWLTDTGTGPLDLTTAAVEWMDELAEPISRQHERFTHLAQRVTSKAGG